VLLGTLPVGRVEPAPIAIGSEALRRAIGDVRVWMPTWQFAEVAAEWDECSRSLDLAIERLDVLDEIAASTDELDHVLDVVRTIMDRLDAFADAEAAFRRHWRCPERSHG
jgi:hypothetical protein